MFILPSAHASIWTNLNTLRNDKILDWSKMKKFANDKINVNEVWKTGLGRVENIVEKGEKCWLSAFSPFPTLFSKALHFRVVKSWDCVVKS